MLQNDSPGRSGQARRFALTGFLIGSLAPLGWLFCQLAFFAHPDLGLGEQVAAKVLGSAEQTLLYLYMGVGTALVFGLFGYFIGKASHQIQERASRLDELNQTIADQKEEFERRFRDLNFNLKNFHATNAHIQKSIDVREVMELAADSLHNILGYDRVNILMLNEKRSTLEMVANRGAEDDDAKGVTLPFDERAGILRQAIRENRIYLVEDMRRMSEELHLKPPYDAVEQLRSRSFILCPITVSGEAVGLFGVDNKIKRKTLNDTDLDTVRLFADQVSSTLTKIKLLEAVGTLTSELERTFAELLKYREKYADQVGSLKDGTQATSQTISQIADSADVIRKAVDDTSSAAGEISVAVQQVAQNLLQINQFMEKSISAMNEISLTTQEVEKNADRSLQMAEKVKQQAEAGVRMTGEAFAGLQGISRAVNQAVRAIEYQSEKSREIDHILAVINDINQKTNLLSLNASIIAAQAGEHGRSFGVVAGEIRNLSLETEQSAQAIEKVIGEIRDSSREAVVQIGETRRLVDEGIELGQGTSETLEEILESAAAAMEMAGDIRKATREQVKSARFVTRSIEDLGGMASQVSQASREQALGTQRIVQAIEEIKALSEEMAATTARHHKDSREIDSAVENVGSMAARIFEEMEERQEESQVIIRQLTQLKGLSRTGHAGAAMAPERIGTDETKRRAEA